MKKLAISIILAVSVFVSTSLVYAASSPIDKIAACANNQGIVSLDSIPATLSCAGISSIVIDGQSIDIQKILSNKEFIVSKKILKSIGYNLVLDLKAQKVYAIKGKNKNDITSFVKSFVSKLK